MAPKSKVARYLLSSSAPQVSIALKLNLARHFLAVSMSSAIKKTSWRRRGAVREVLGDVMEDERDYLKR